jgi:Sec-independent protein translocase protein TatA
MFKVFAVFQQPASGGEILFILVCVLFLFVCDRNPDFAYAIGRALREFGNAILKLTQVFDQAGFDAGQNLGGIHGKPAAEAITTENTNVELYDPAALNENTRLVGRGGREKRRGKNALTRILLFIAGGLVFGVLAFRFCKWLFLNSN